MLFQISAQKTDKVNIFLQSNAMINNFAACTPARMSAFYVSFCIFNMTMITEYDSETMQFKISIQDC